jgi:hypothetical protein
VKIDDARAWQNAVLDEVFAAIASDPALTSVLIFKGARVLARHLPEAARQSLDLDANYTDEFLRRYPENAERAAIMAEQLQVALHRHFEAASPVRYEVDSVRVDPMPPHGHPRGWNALLAKIRVRDLSRPGALGLPALTLDLAAPEWLSEHSTTTLEIAGRPVTAYTLERVAGEKLRAFLSTTPAYQLKKAGNRETLRVKDLPDLGRILRHEPLADRKFWRIAGEEFRGACESRGIDCAGWRTFAEVEDLTRDTYATDASVAASMPFPDAWVAVRAIIERFAEEGIVPFAFPLPDRVSI